jgi:hypothetical protein
VRQYQRYLAGEHAWMLGHFIVPASRLEEFSEVFRVVCCDEREYPWTLSVVCGEGSMPVDLKAVEDFKKGAAFISSLEMKADDARMARAVLGALPRGRIRYIEIAPDRKSALLPLLYASGARAKIRTGGLTAAAIPPPEQVAWFLMECAQARVAFKATAGLHHPVRSVHPLTSQMGGAEAKMHGFLNVFLAAALAFNGSTEAALLATLTEEDPEAFRLTRSGIAWHDHRVTADQMERVRTEFAASFGSCSFTEPIDDLKAMGWL